MSKVSGMLAALLVGAMIGLGVAHLADASLLGGLAIGAGVGFILGFGFMSLPPLDKNPRDFFPD